MYLWFGCTLGILTFLFWMWLLFLKQQLGTALYSVPIHKTGMMRSLKSRKKDLTKVTLDNTFRGKFDSFDLLQQAGKWTKLFIPLSLSQHNTVSHFGHVSYIIISRCPIDLRITYLAYNTLTQQKKSYYYCVGIAYITKHRMVVPIKQF